MPYQVEYYEKPNGECPAEAFILAQDNKMQAKIFTALTFLEEAGPALREPYSKSWETASLRFAPSRVLISAGCFISLSSVKRSS